MMAYAGDLSEVDFAYLERGEVPEGYVAGPVPGLFVLPGVPAPSLALAEALVRAGVEPVAPGEGAGAEAVLVYAVVTVRGIEYLRFGSLSSMPYYGYAWLDESGEVWVGESVPGDVGAALNVSEGDG